MGSNRLGLYYDYKKNGLSQSQQRGTDGLFFTSDDTFAAVSSSNSGYYQWHAARVDFEVGLLLGTDGTRFYDSANGRKLQPSEDMWIYSLWGLRYNRRGSSGGAEILHPPSTPKINPPGMPKLNPRNPKRKQVVKRGLLGTAGAVGLAGRLRTMPRAPDPRVQAAIVVGIITLVLIDRLIEYEPGDTTTSPPVPNNCDNNPMFLNMPKCNSTSFLNYIPPFIYHDRKTAKRNLRDLTVPGQPGKFKPAEVETSGICKSLGTTGQKVNYQFKSVYRKKRDFLGSITCCVCCEDTKDGPIQSKRCNIKLGIKFIKGGK